MPCAVVRSPMFSPSPVFSKSTASSPISRNLYVSSSLSPSNSSSVSPLRSLTLRLPTQTRNFIRNEINEDPSCSTSSTTPTPVLKRKRPAKINIPILPLNFESCVQTPRGDDRLDEVEVEGEGYSVYCKRGKRGVMEDRYSAIVDHQDSKQVFFAIFDGHGGAAAAEFSARNMGRNIMNEVSAQSEELEKAVKEGYLTTDDEFLKQNIRGGASCVTALIHENKLIVSNAGDCRAVISRGGVAEALTVDHRPSRESEKERVEALGGYVDCLRGVWRIQGSLAVSRGIGDSELKRWVIADPETTTTILSDPELEFLILASDGVWDKVSNQEAVDAVRSVCIGVDNPNPLSACKEIVNMALTRGSFDDISAMVIHLSHFVQ
ncbi:unnamed protein product [Cuscuta epithymum]|uniref:protein-serine/threonine phosphatase n=1 Tax=Cuscuta epithymum TaxID=186058 RepID=A0AAV0ET01_9ASTE|nr:unnamed protein product [Cuscuta epithymum]